MKDTSLAGSTNKEITVNAEPKLQSTLHELENKTIEEKRLKLGLSLREF